MSATVRDRSESATHEIRIEFEVSGMPVYAGPDLCTKRPITPEIAKITYRRAACSGPWASYATVYGDQQRIGRGWANFYAHARDRWPDWLVALVDEHAPPEVAVHDENGAQA